MLPRYTVHLLRHVHLRPVQSQLLLPCWHRAASTSSSSLNSSSNSTCSSRRSFGSNAKIKPSDDEMDDTFNNTSFQRATVGDYKIKVHKTTSSAQLQQQIQQITDLPQQKAVQIQWKDGFRSKFHKKWLRDHCQCPICLHPETRQRMVDTASIPADPTYESLQQDKTGRQVEIHWCDDVKGNSCTKSVFDAEWLRDNAYGPPASSSRKNYPHRYAQQKLEDKVLWNGQDLSVPTFEYETAFQDITPTMVALYKYGLVQINNSPSTIEATENFARLIGFPLETIYGGMWTTNPETEEQSYNDTASTKIELHAHTDMTYYRDPAGLQVFNCVAQASTGGESRYMDAFYVVEELRKNHPDAFEFFCKTPLHFQHFDDDCHLATMEPMIQLDYLGKVKFIRHNDYDRATLNHLSFDQVTKFYEYQQLLLNLMRQPGREAVLKMDVGQMFIVDNQRVFHGRYAFEGGPRALVGCYIGRNEYDSRLRLLGLL